MPQNRDMPLLPACEYIKDGGIYFKKLKIRACGNRLLPERGKEANIIRMASHVFEIGKIPDRGATFSGAERKKHDNRNCR